MILLKFQELVVSSPAKRDKFILSSFTAGVLFNAVLWVALIFNFWASSEYIILRYNIYFGISSFGPWLNILLIPFVGGLIITVNFLLAFYFYFDYKILSYFLSFSATGLNLIILIAGFLLIYINL